MKKVNILILGLIALSIPLQKSCAQIRSCPPNNEKAEKVLKEYLSIEIRLQSLRNLYNMPITNEAKDNLKPLVGEKYEEECRQLRSNIEWLEKQEHYSIYKVANHYFIVLYSFTEKGDFQVNSIPIVNSNYKGIGSIIYPDTLK